MKIVHFTLGSVNPNSSNGINRVIEGHAKFVNDIDSSEVHVITLKNKQKEKVKIIKRDGFDVTIFNSLINVIYYLRRRKDSIDLVHLHNVWSIQNIIISKALNAYSIPFVVTVHAGLMEDRVKDSNYFFKLLFQFFFQKKHLNEASAIHAIAREEMTNISQYCSNQNIFYLPNGIEANKVYSVKEELENEKIRIGYLGRLSEEKNIIGLINAISKLDNKTLKEIQLIIMGPIKNKYAHLCIDLVKKLELDKTIVFDGKVDSDKKWHKLSQLDIYIQVSFSEGASLTILEAMQCGLPLILSRTCNISYLHGQEFLEMVEPLPSDISRAIQKAVNNIGPFKESGKKAHNFIVKELNWKHIAQGLIGIYAEIINKKKLKKTFQ